MLSASLCFLLKDMVEVGHHRTTTNNNAGRVHISWNIFYVKYGHIINAFNINGSYFKSYFGIPRRKQNVKIYICLFVDNFMITICIYPSIKRK